MNKIIHRANTRGRAEHGWLHSYHTFSFAGYYNLERMGFGKLRVLNDDVVEPGKGFGTHSHDNMEIVSIPLSGSLRHQGNMGNAQVIQKGEIQIMSAGTGVTHSEYNNSDSEQVNFLQIWVLPKEMNLPPNYEQKIFNPEDRKNRFQLLVSPNKRDGSLEINQNTYFSLGNFDAGTHCTYSMHSNGNGVYFFLIDGQIQIEKERLDKRDAIGLSERNDVEINALTDSNQDRAPMVTVTKDGPYAITGGIELVGQPLGDATSTEHYTLCRCGGSKNKPFCDGTHWHIGFKDEKN